MKLSDFFPIALNANLEITELLSLIYSNKEVINFDLEEDTLVLFLTKYELDYHLKNFFTKNKNAKKN